MLTTLVIVPRDMICENMQSLTGPNRLTVIEHPLTIAEAFKHAALEFNDVLVFGDGVSPEVLAYYRTRIRPKFVNEKVVDQNGVSNISAYGYCPSCGGYSTKRERRPDGNDTCVNGHTYPSKMTRPLQVVETILGS